MGKVRIRVKDIEIEVEGWGLVVDGESMTEQIKELYNIQKKEKKR